LADSAQPALKRKPRPHPSQHFLNAPSTILVPMFESQDLSQLSKPERYAELESAARGLLSGEPNRIANAANFAALVFHSLPDLNWAGFYIFDGTELVVGPFQGRPACVRIALDRGVCGAAASTLETQRVADVHAFPGHIACDAASRSEIVIPIVSGGALWGVFDIDAPIPDRFDEDDQRGLETLVRVFAGAL